jgi:hypothetical protein
MKSELFDKMLERISNGELTSDMGVVTAQSTVKEILKVIASFKNVSIKEINN